MHPTEFNSQGRRRRAGECFYATDDQWTSFLQGGGGVPPIRVIQNDTTIRCSPNLLIIGVQKGGTTELRNALIQGNRDSVRAVAPWRLEPHILDSPLAAVDNTYLLAHDYLRHAPVSPTEFLNLEVMMDKTPRYFHHLPIRLAYFDGISLVVMLRDPAERLFSAYWHVCLINLTRGMRHNCTNAAAEQSAFESLSRWDAAVRNSSEAALRVELENNEQMKLVTVGFYARHLRRIANQFGTNSSSGGRLLVTFSEDFEQDGQAYFDRLARFLNVTKLHHPAAAAAAAAKKTTTTNTTALRFNSLRAPGYARPSKDAVDRIRTRIYGDSLRELRGLLQSTAATSTLIAGGSSSLKVTVDRSPDKLPSWIMNA